MANIVSFTTDVAGQSGSFVGGVVPRAVRMVVSDSLAVVTTPGYLTAEFLGGYAINPTDAIFMWYGFNNPNSPGQFGIFTPTFVNGVITLTQVGSVTVGTFTLNTLQVTGAFATPVQLLPPPGPGLVYVVDQAIIYTASTGHTPYAGGGIAIVQYGNAAAGAGTDALSATIPAVEITAAASQIYILNGNTGNALTGISNQGLFFSNQTGAFTGGTGTNVVITLQYYVIAATV